MDNLPPGPFVFTILFYLAYIVVQLIIGFGSWFAMVGVSVLVQKISPYTGRLTLFISILFNTAGYFSLSIWRVHLTGHHFSLALWIAIFLFLKYYYNQRLKNSDYSPEDKLYFIGNSISILICVILSATLGPFAWY
jgi:hypothetical protein